MEKNIVPTGFVKHNYKELVLYRKVQFNLIDDSHWHDLAP